MFAWIAKLFKNAAKIEERNARIAAWNELRNELIEMKFRLVNAYEVLTYGTYNRAMKGIKHRLARVNKLLELANA